MSNPSKWSQFQCNSFSFGMLHLTIHAISSHHVLAHQPQFHSSHDALWREKVPPNSHSLSHFQSNHRAHKNCIIYDYIFLMIHILLLDCAAAAAALLPDKIYEVSLQFRWVLTFFSYPKCVRSDCISSRETPWGENRLMLFNPKKIRNRKHTAESERECI